MLVKLNSGVTYKGNKHLHTVRTQDDCITNCELSDALAAPWTTLDNLKSGRFCSSESYGASCAGEVTLFPSRRFLYRVAATHAKERDNFS